MGESVAALFAAGIVPSILVGVGLMLVTAFMERRGQLPAASTRATWHERGQASLRAFFPLLTPVIILGGILAGIFTPTEASAIAVAYALVVSVFILKTMTFADIPQLLIKSATTSAVVLLLVGAAVRLQNRSQLIARARDYGGVHSDPIREPIDSVISYQPAAIYGWYVPGCWAGDNHPWPHTGADIPANGRAPSALRHYHER